jgi:aminocarboxymuconate-semialdehyde decarboxylase
MTTRRQFFQDAGAMAGIGFVGCGLLKGAQPQTGRNARRRQVTVGGRRVKTVDVHGHVIVPEAIALLGRKPNENEAQAGVSIEERLRAMDEQGLDVQAISINPYWYAAEREVAGQIVKLQNEKLAELCATHPDRFVAYATVALQYPDLAAEQLEEGVKKLGLRGASIGARVNGEELAAPRFHPFWAKAEELGVLVFMHPAALPELQKRLQGNGVLTNVIGNPLDTTIALSHLIFEGTLDRFPRLKLCAAHGGGYLPSYADRSDHGCLTFPEACNPTPLQKHPTEYLKQLYFDSLVFTSEALRHLIAQTGASRIMIGTDYPYPWNQTAVDHILGTPGLSNADRRAILGGTAAKLLGIAS